MTQEELNNLLALSQLDADSVKNEAQYLAELDKTIKALRAQADLHEAELRLRLKNIETFYNP
jgi:hypothetical protein